jgi:hypothetical protein
MFRRFFSCQSAITIGAGSIGAPLAMADYKEEDRIRCVLPIFMLIADYLAFTNRKRKYFEEKTTITLKSKQTSIATIRNHLTDPPHFSLVTTLKFSIVHQTRKAQHKVNIFFYNYIFNTQLYYKLY